MPGATGWPGTAAPARPADSAAVFRIIWSAIGAVGTVAEVSGTSEDDAWWDSWYRPEPSAARLPPVVEQRPPRGRHGRRGRKRRKLPYVLVAAAVAAAAAYQCGAGAAGRRVHADYWLPADGLIGWPGRAADSPRLPARLGRGSPSAGGELHRSSGCRQGRPYGFPDVPPPQEAHQYGRVGNSDLAGLGDALGRRSSTRPAPAWPRRTAPRRSAESGVTTHRWSPIRRSNPSTGTSPGHPLTWLLTSPRPRTLHAVPVAPRVTSVTDASGNDLTSYGDAGLHNIAAGLEAGAPPGYGSPGLNVEIQSKTGKPLASTQAVVVAPRNVSGLATTIDAAAEQAARSAVGLHNNSSMVVIQPSTGKILAIANNAGFNDFALTAAVAPGSTMKTITSTALFNEGVLNPASHVACPKTFTIQGITYHNDKGESESPSTPFITDFAQSCNNAFSTQWEHLTNGRLAETARKYYGLDQKWDIGIGRLSASYFNAPASASGSELAQEAFGEGSLTASPLAMASIAATIASGQVPAALPGSGWPAGHCEAASSHDRHLAEGDDAGRGHQRHGRADRVRRRCLRQDWHRGHRRPRAAQQLAHRLRAVEGRRSRLPGSQRRLWRSSRWPRGQGLSRQLLILPATVD